MFATTTSRGRFLRGDFRGRHPSIRPPWAVDEGEFTERCTRCGDCIVACPSHIVVNGPGRFPQIDFFRGECTFCGRCASACRAGALRFDACSSPWQLVARITDRCVTLNGVVCRSCGDACETHAIRFELRSGGVAAPELRPDGCSGCGACLATCPGNAIEIGRPTGPPPA